MKNIVCKYITVITLLIFPLEYNNVKAQNAGTVDIFAGVDLNYRDIYFNGRVYDFLINLTPGVKWYMGKGWQSSAQVIVPIVNQYGDRYKKVRLNMAVLSKEMYFGNRMFLKASGGLFGQERYGLDVKGMYIVNSWLAFEAQTGLTGYCSMAVDWEASKMRRITALGGADIYLNKWNTQFRMRGGRFLYEDYGCIGEVMRHFRHCTVGVYAQYSDKAKKDYGFKIVMMIPPYKRARKKVNIRPASNFRHIYSFDSDGYANVMYRTDPEENEREGWFDRNKLHWGSNNMTPDFTEKERREE